MVYERLGDSPLDYKLCSYAGSKLQFRGPPRKLKGRYAAFLGGTSTYGKFIEQPFPALIEARTGVKCVNFGWPNAGVDVYLNDQGVITASKQAQLAVLQIPCVQNISNRLYAVHPRRNDRFLEASGKLRSLYSEVDFTEFHFVRHMLNRLQSVSSERFGIVREEIQSAWLARMKLLLNKIGPDCVLLWLSARDPDEDVEKMDPSRSPNFVTRAILEELRPLTTQLVEVTASDKALAEGTKGMAFSDLEAPAAQKVLGPSAHYEAADILTPIIAELVGS